MTHVHVSFIRLGLVAAAALAFTSCEPAPEAAAPLGAPLPGLTAEQLARFEEGERAFNHVFTPEEGVGPLFNENQCSACHTSPQTGGTGEQFLVRASRFQPPDRCDLMVAAGGENVRTQSTPLLRAHGIDRQPFPADATEQTRFNVPFLFGLGLIEAIPEEEILANADPEDADGDGISGRAGRDARGRTARFGRKADLATIRDFTETALRLEMGLTTTRHPDEGTITGLELPPDFDPAPDPEVDAETVDRLTDFVRFLAAPERRHYTDPGLRASAERGKQRFAAIGCTSCHLPEMTTGPNEVEALDRKRVFLYSDLLLHDMGPAFAGVCGPGASPTELRTGILMALRHRDAYLHDGRTADLMEAILLHGGEAAAARERFRSLDRLEQEEILTFLRGL